MRRQISVALAAGLLMAGVSGASAAGMSQPNSTMSRPASDTLSLTDYAAEGGVERLCTARRPSRRRRPASTQ